MREEKTGGEGRLSQYDYVNDALWRRTSVKYSGSAFGALSDTFNRYDYNSRSELVSAYRFWGTAPSDPTADPVSGQAFAYSYDNIGNRVTSDVGAVPRTANYTANELNQYLQRTVPGYVDILGEANPEATVTINNEPVTRQQAYWHKELEVENDAEAVRQKVHVVGVLSNVVSSEKGYIFVPQDPERFAYDADGNMTSDGRYIYTWDAENRLIAVESKECFPPAHRKRVEFSYDYMGRRVDYRLCPPHGEKGDQEHGVGKQPRLLCETAFIYDGWNLIEEIVLDYPGEGLGTEKGSERFRNPKSEIRNRYVWGLDLSGTIQGAGGIGGLLAVIRSDPNSPQPSVYFPLYDANGNITDYVDTNGVVVAHREYDPFGNTIVSTGSKKDDFSFWFSTKYYEPWWNLYYYGIRYYNPSLGRWLSRDPLLDRLIQKLWPIVRLQHLFPSSVSGCGVSCSSSNIWYSPFLRSGFSRDWLPPLSAVHSGIITSLRPELASYTFVGNSHVNSLDPLGLKKDPACAADCWADYSADVDKITTAHTVCMAAVAFTCVDVPVWRQPICYTIGAAACGAVSIAGHTAAAAAYAGCVAGCPDVCP